MACCDSNFTVEEVLLLQFLLTMRHLFHDCLIPSLKCVWLHQKPKVAYINGLLFQRFLLVDSLSHARLTETPEKNDYLKVYAKCLRNLRAYVFTTARVHDKDRNSYK